MFAYDLAKSREGLPFIVLEQMMTARLTRLFLHTCVRTLFELSLNLFLALTLIGAIVGMSLCLCSTR